MTTLFQKPILSCGLLILLLIGLKSSSLGNRNVIVAMFEWPAWLGGSYLSDDCDCDGPYTTPEGETYYWKVCETKNLWGLNSTGWGQPFITNEPCM